MLLISSKLPDPLKEKIKLLIEDLEACTLLLDRFMVKRWRNEVREMSFDLEDYIDKTTHPYSNQFDAEEFGILVDLARDACKWSPDASFAVGSHELAPVLNKETYVVGIDEARHELISLLRDDADQGRKVVAIHGPAGVGKTTLAQEVYREIGGDFECRAFVRACRVPDASRLLRSIISQIQRHQRPSGNCTVQKLIDSLREYLLHKRYFIVLDGLWETTTWDIITNAFPVGTYSSRILITTDIEEVAQECSGYQSDAILLVKPLSRDYCTRLLNYRLSCYKHEPFDQLNENLEDIIRTCGGLPLATISIANILASQPDDSNLWCRVKDCLSSRLRNNLTPEGVLREILDLSYNCLPHELKVCLLYLSMYPDGYAFSKADLLKQWTAEGFISAVQENVNEFAESYFDQLVWRGLIQSNHINSSDTVVTYTVHSSMFGVIRCKSIEENFTTVIDYSNTIPDLSAKVRRLSLRYSNAKYATKPEGITMAPVRSLMFYGLVECLPSLTEFEVLRVLNLEVWGYREELDLSGISQLFQLRYVRITTDIVVKLPAEMKGLKFLETLEVYARVSSVPPDIVLLPGLLHVCLPGKINLSEGISHLRSLRTLQNFDLSSNSEDNVRCLGEMRDLHDLRITCSNGTSDALERNLIALASSMGKLYNLNSFVLAPDTSCSSIYSDCTSCISSPPIFLQNLEVLPPICMFSRLPQWIGRQLRMLCVLKIVIRHLTTDDVDSIAGLQKLTVLSLFVRQPSEETIVINRAAFPVLRHFKFRCGIVHLAFQAETMPTLRRLKLEFNAHSGDKYDDMLIGIGNLLNIQEVAGRIGAVPGAEETDWLGAESALKAAVVKHSNPPAVNVRRVIGWVDEEISHFSELLPASPSTLDMASGASTDKSLESQSSLKSTLLNALPANYIKGITDDFYPERVVVNSPFGTVYKGVAVATTQPESTAIGDKALATVQAKDRSLSTSKNAANDSNRIISGCDTSITNDHLDLSSLCFDAADQLIQLWDATPQALFFEAPKDDVAHYLAAVDVIVDHLTRGGARAVGAGNTVQVAMARLEKELRNLMDQHAFLPDPMAFSWSFRDSSISSLETDTTPLLESREDLDSVSSLDFDGTTLHSLDDGINDLFSDPVRFESVIEDLRAIAERMARAGYARKLTDAYCSVRRDLLVKYLSELGVENLSVDEVKRIEWKHLNDKMKKWVNVVNTLVHAQLAAERRLCDQVFVTAQELREECFIESTKGYIMRILNVGDAVTRRPRAPETTARMLDMYEALAGLISEMKVLFVGSSGDGVTRDAQNTLDRLGDAVRGNLFVFRKLLQQESSRRAMTAGQIHPMARYVLNYLKLMLVYSDTLDVLLNNDSSEDLDAFENQEHMESMRPPVGRLIMRLISYLETNLEEISKLYEDAALQCIFSMNNCLYIIQKVTEDSKLGKLLGDHWIQMRKQKIRQYSKSYLRISWAKVLSYLRESETGSGSSNDSGHSSSRKSIKIKFKNFNLAFEEIYRNQTCWKVPDPQLREELRMSISDNIIPNYRAFFGRYGSQLKGGTNQEKYIKYSPEDLDNHISNLFEG